VGGACSQRVALVRATFVNGKLVERAEDQQAVSLAVETAA